MISVLLINQWRCSLSISIGIIIVLHTIGRVLLRESLTHLDLLWLLCILAPLCIVAIPKVVLLLLGNKNLFKLIISIEKGLSRHRVAWSFGYCAFGWHLFLQFRYYKFPLVLSLGAQYLGTAFAAIREGIHGDGSTGSHGSDGALLDSSLFLEDSLHLLFGV
jgi:hypothetical protein